MAGSKPRIDKGVPKKGMHKTERETILRVKKQARDAEKRLKGS